MLELLIKLFNWLMENADKAEAIKTYLELGMILFKAKSTDKVETKIETTPVEKSTEVNSKSNRESA